MSQPDKVIAVCPACKSKLAVPSSAVGKKIRCPKCQTVVAITSEMVSQPPEKPPEILPIPTATAERAQRPDVSLGAENTFTGPAKKNAASESLGDQATFGGKRGIDDAVVDDDMEIVDLSARYTIEGVLGKGGMGEVQLATDNRLKRKVAIKRVLGDMAKNQTAVRRFMTEAQSIAALNHPNIVQVYDYGRDKNGPFLILEYVEGKSLLDRCQQGAMPLEEAITLTCYLCDGLSRAHELGIVHRDLKPANVLLTKDGVPKLTDFGLARVETGDTGHTMSGAVLGTLDFMPPEQRRDATQADARSDLWSLAATLYQMVTGKSPKVIRLNEVPTSLQSALGRALEDKPADRYSSVVEFRNALREALNEGQTTLTHLSEGQCPSCGTKNELSRKFCRKCAVSLEMNCLSCSKGMPVWDEVCGSCGTKQSPLITARKEQMQQRQEQAEQFVREGRFREAEQIAAEIQREDDPRFQHLKKWAVDFSEGSKREQRQQQERAGVLHKEARAHQQAYDYSSAIHALEQIPAGLRSADINALLKKLQTQEQRSKDLDEEIRVCVERRQLDGLMPRVDELLQLLPDRVDLRELRDTLEQREQQRLAAKNSAKAEAQQLLDAHKYAECVAVLQRLDGKLRTPDIETLQKDAASKLSRVQNLQKSIDQGVKNNQLQGLLAKLDELLSLKSEVTVADSQLRGQLLSREQKQKSQIKALLQKVQQLRKEVRFDEALELLRRVPDELQNDAIMTAVEDLQFFADQRSETIEGLTQAHDQRQIEQALALADEYRGMLTSAIIADTAFESAMKECRQRLEEVQQAEELAVRRRQRQKTLIIIGSVVSLLLLVAVAGFIMLRQLRLTAIADAQKRGDDALQAADSKAAIEAYGEVIRLDNTVADAWAGLALAKLQQTPSDVTSAFGDLEKSAALSPDGEKLQQARRLAHARRAIERANAGSVAEALLDVADAEKLAAPAEEVAAAKSAVGSAYLKRAEEAVAAMQLEAALKELQEARAISPQSDLLPRVSQMIAESYLDRATASVQQSAVEAALAAIEAARALQPALTRIPELQAAALVIRAQQQLQAGDRDNASADFLEARTLSPTTAGLGALAASLADGLVKRCESAFSDASFQEATAALQTVAELDSQSVTLGSLKNRLSKVLIVEADKGLLAKETDRVALLIESLVALQLQPEEQTRLSNDLAGQYFEQCQQQVAAGDLPASVSTFERLLALASVDDEKKQQAMTALLAAIEPLCLTGLQSESPDPAIKAVQSLAQADVEFGRSFKDQLKTLSDDVKNSLPTGLLETPLTDGTVASSVKIASGLNGGPTLTDIDYFGASVASLGDLDGDGVTDLAAGAFGDDTGGTNRGAVYVLFMNANGTTKSFTKIASGLNGGPTLSDQDQFGESIASLGDLDGDGVTDLAVGADLDDTGGGNRGALHVLLLNANGTVKNSMKIASGLNGGPTLANSDRFGFSVAPLGDLDGDGVTDRAVGALHDDMGGNNRGAVHVLLLNANGMVKSTVKIASGTNGGPTLADGVGFGVSVASLGDLDGDGVTELAVGALDDDTGGTNRGAVHMLLLNATGIVKSSVKIASSLNGGPTLANVDEFGRSVASLGDLNGDDVTDLVVGATGSLGGAVHLLLLNANGTVASSVKIASGLNGGPTLADGDGFGMSVASLGDLNGDGVTDLVVGAQGDETGGTDRGAVYVLFFKRLTSQLNKQALPLAIAPFDTAQAKVHQKAWADHLGVPVESTNSIGMKLVLIPPGEFMMGSPESEPDRVSDETLHKVTLPQPFQMGMYEVTQAEYQQVVGKKRFPNKFKGVSNPVDNVGWDDVVEFCTKLSALPSEQAAGRVYRVPKEAEWEYACRAGTTTAYSFGDDALQLGEYAWFDDNSDRTTHAVGTKKANPWGLYDMHGNVVEWCEDEYAGSSRVYRSSGWNFDAGFCRSAYRNLRDPSVRSSSMGIRLALSPPGE